MSTTLDTLAAQAVYASHLLERSLHDPGPWSFEVDGSGVHVPATRVVEHDCVRFVAAVSGLVGTVYLRCGDEPVAWFCVDKVLGPDDSLSWRIGQPVPVS